MKAILDTNTFLWWITGKMEKLSPRAEELITDGQNELLFSVASGWEIAIKAQLKKLRFSADSSLEELLHQQIRFNSFQILPIQLDHALHVFKLPRYHRDPFDRLLIAQSQIEQIPLLTSDSQIKKYDVETLW